MLRMLTKATIQWYQRVFVDIYENFRFVTSIKHRSSLQHCVMAACSDAASGSVTNSESVLAPPSCVLGMKILDKDLFKKKVKVQALPVPLKNLNLVSKELTKWIPKASYLRNNLNIRLEGEKIVVFDPDKVQSVNDINENLKSKLKEAGCDFGRWFEDVIELTYDNWSVKDILQAVIPKDVGPVTSYSVVGHIAHLNLKPELLEYKHVIGEVLLGKMKPIRTVVNKLNNIDNTYRNFQMELLAGEDEMVTTAKENGFSYKLDFGKVYWNSRLSSEHQRLVDKMKKHDLMFDVFAGVGPFAIPAAKKGVIVFANDLNPHSYQSLLENIPLNKVQDNIQSSNLDGREFIRSIVKKELLGAWQIQGESRTIHVVMNLPALAVTFLDEFIGLLSEKTCDQTNYPDSLLPLIHCHVFGKCDDTKQAAIKQVEDNLQEPLPEGCEVKWVRNVAPSKDMYCISFRMPKHLIFKVKDNGASRIEQASEDDPPSKKMKCDE